MPKIAPTHRVLMHFFAIKASTLPLHELQRYLIKRKYIDGFIKARPSDQVTVNQIILYHCTDSIALLT